MNRLDELLTYRATPAETTPFALVGRRFYLKNFIFTPYFLIGRDVYINASGENISISATFSLAELWLQILPDDLWYPPCSQCPPSPQLLKRKLCFASMSVGIELGPNCEECGAGV